MIKFLLLTMCILGKLTATDLSNLPDRLVEKNQSSSSRIVDGQIIVPHTASSWKAETVDTQIETWKKIHAAKRKAPNFSYKETHFPEVLERIVYMVGYVRKTISGQTDRLIVVDKLMQRAEILFANQRLTFHSATELFDSLAMVSDYSIPLSKPRKSRWRSREAEVERNLAFLCVPKGGLRIERFVDTCLSEFPLRYVALPNRQIKDEPHGADHSIYEFFDHDSGHAYQGDVVIWVQLWPGLKKIGDYRNTLSPNSCERKSIDVFLFRFFHEANFSYNDPYPPCQITSSRHSITKDLETFAPFIERLGSISKLYPFLPGNSYLVLSGVEDLEELLIKKNILSDGKEVREFSLNKTDKGFALEVSRECSMPCAAKFEGDIVTATKPVLTKLKIGGEEVSCTIRTQQLVIAAFFDDPLYLLRYAGVTTLCDGSSLPTHVLPSNLFAVAERFNQLIDDTGLLIFKGCSFIQDSISS